jgi:Family of unknown function (DUF6488)
MSKKPSTPSATPSDAHHHTVCFRFPALFNPEEFTMKTALSIATFTIAVATVGPANAGEDSACHFHGNKPVPEATVLSCASQYKDKLAAGGKIDKTWQAVTRTDKVEQVDGKKGKEWKITYKNPAAADKSKDTLFLFYAPSGNLIAANHTGP